MQSLYLWGHLLIVAPYSNEYQTSVCLIIPWGACKIFRWPPLTQLQEKTDVGSESVFSKRTQGTELLKTFQPHSEQHDHRFSH